MKHMHLHSLMDETMTTVGVVFYPDDPSTAQYGGKNQVRKNSDYFDEDDIFADSDEDRASDLSSEYSGKKYTYKVPKEWNVQLHEKLVVPIQRDGKMHFRVATVARVDAAADIDPDATYPYRWAVSQIDFDGFECRRQRERDFNTQMLEVERTKKREELVSSFREALPVGSEARRLFDRTTRSLSNVAEFTVPDAGDGNAEA